MMRWLAVFATLFCLAATPAAALGNRLRLVYIAPPSPLPATQTVRFGVKTLVGFGGSPMGYANPQNLGFTRFLCITSQTDASAGSVSLFTIDERSMLVPKNGAGAYGTTWGGPSNGPYTVNVQESYTACGTNNATASPTGNTTIITVPIDAATATIREMTSVLRGCNTNVMVCASLHPDGGTGAFSSTTHQLNTMLTTGTPLVLGDTIKGRDGQFNPTSLGYRVRPLASYTGSGRLTITSETWDAANDANGNPRLQHGYQIGAIIFDAAVAGAVVWPIDFSHVWFYFNVPGPAQGAMFAYAGSSTGVGFYYNRVELGSLVSDHNLTNGLSLKGAATVDHNHFLALRTDVLGTTSLTVSWNICENQSDDFLIMTGANNNITDNFCFNWRGQKLNHMDFMQSLGQQSGGIVAFGSELRNISVINAGDISGTSPQGSFNDDSTYGNGYSGAVVKNNILNHVAPQQTLLTFFDAPTYSYNTVLAQTGITGGASQFNIQAPTITASISGTTLTVTNAAVGSITPNALLIGSGVTAGTVIVSQLTQGAHCPSVTGTGAPGVGCTGTYSITPSQTLTSRSMTAGKGGTDATITNNVYNSYNLSAQHGTVTTTDSLTFALSGAAYLTAFPNYVAGANPGIVTRAAAIHAFTPANLAVGSGGVKNADGTISGALFPANDFGEVCWNDGSVWDHTAHCTAAQ